MPEIKTEIPAEIVGEAEHGGLIAVAAVITTLLAALTGFLQASALNSHDQADVRAERLAVLSLDASAGSLDQAQVQIERFQLTQQAERQQASAQDFAQYAGQSSAGLEAARWGTVVKDLAYDSMKIAKGQRLIATCPASSDHECLGGQPLPVICSPSVQGRSCGTSPGQGGWYSSEQDPSFPGRYRQAAQRESYFLSAQRDGYNERADAAEARFVRLAATLTMFAVSVFLFGYSLTPQGRRRRRLFSRVATVFVGFGAIWGLSTIAGGIPNPSLASSVAYADGLVQLNDGDYAAADHDLTRAIALKPRFVGAWTELAQAKYGEGTPSTYLDNEGTQIPTLGAMRAAASADQHAIDGGSDSPTVRFDLGANLLYLGLLTHHENEVRLSRGDSADSYARFHDQLRQGGHPGQYLVMAEFNVAEADLVDDSANADAEYRQAEADLLSVQSETGGVEPVVADALSDLNLIAQTRLQLAAETTALAQKIVDNATHDRSDGWDYTAMGDHAPSGDDSAHLGGVELQPDPGHLEYTIQRPGRFDPLHDTLSVQWEYRDPVNRNWEVLPDISGPVADGLTDSLQRNGGGTYISSNPSFIAETVPHTCLPPGQYRTVLYVNGRFAGQSSPKSSTWSSLVGTGFGGTDAGFCRPAGWRGFPIGLDLSAFTSPKGGSGAVLFTFPTQALAGLSPAEVMRIAVTALSVGKSPVPRARAVDTTAPSYFMNLPNAREQLWAYYAGVDKAGVMWSAAGSSPAGEVYVGLVYGSAANAQTAVGRLADELKNLLLSYSQL